MNLTQTALIEYIASGATLTPEMRKELADQLHKLYQVEEAYNVWQDKTDWIQEDARPGELGMHRADAMKARLESWESVGLTMNERRMLVDWYNAADTQACMDGADKRLAERIKNSVKD